MGDKSKIQWTDATWNVSSGCTKVSPGCAHCYITRTPPFRVAGRKFVKGSTDIQLHENRLTQPIRWKRPRRIFVNSLSDLFHESIPDDFILRVFAVMAIASQHIFQVLTKRPERMRTFISYLSKSINPLEAIAREVGYTFKFQDTSLLRWPIPNVWLGVTVENQRFADERIPYLLQTPAAIRFISYEPALGPVTLTSLCGGTRDALSGADFENLVDINTAKLDWVICGGESGPRPRPMQLGWASDLMKECFLSEVPFFMKQICDAHGRQIPFEQWPEGLRVREFPQSITQKEQHA